LLLSLACHSCRRCHRLATLTLFVTRHLHRHRHRLCYHCHCPLPRPPPSSPSLSPSLPPSPSLTRQTCCGYHRLAALSLFGVRHPHHHHHCPLRLPPPLPSPVAAAAAAVMATATVTATETATETATAMETTPMPTRTVQLSTSCCAAASHCAPPIVWYACLSSAPVICRVTSHHAVTSRPPAPPTLIAPPPLTAPLLCHLSGWLSRCLSSRQRLPSASASDSCRTVTSICAPFVPLFTLAVRRPGAILAHKASKSSRAMETFPSSGRSLSCCLLSSAASRPAAPPSVHILLERSLSLCPSSSLVRSPLVRPGCLSCHLS
jgi:hypothetical protein